MKSCDPDSVLQDFHRFVDAIYMMSQFIREFIAEVGAETDELLAPLDISPDQFWRLTAPSCLAEFLNDPLLSKTNHKRTTRFNKMVGPCQYSFNFANILSIPTADDARVFQ